ncbi:hypothetical protein KJ966_06005 [bacterium]|nr:hypothetical protein [bacterium]
MNSNLKIIYGCLAVTALVFGFLHLVIPGSVYNFERLHVFLFNLCGGGTLILFFTLKKKAIPVRVTLFLIFSIAYAIFAFLKIYIPAMILSIILALIVESVRAEKFSFLPLGFFRREEPVHLKFHQASLLCLSMGLVISTLVILNNEYLKLIYMPKLQLDTFFLGFSFPLSLITFSLIFSFMGESDKQSVLITKEAGFWLVNLGVIIFFTFIIFEQLHPQVFVTITLFITVMVIFYLFYRLGKNIQQKHFLISGLGFLVVTAVSGIAYILMHYTDNYSPSTYKWLLNFHAFASLYGWNLCGLSVICRYNDFPVRLHSFPIILLHWITVLLFAPLGKEHPLFALLALLGYAMILFFLLFSRRQLSPINQ